MLKSQINLSFVDTSATDILRDTLLHGLTNAYRVLKVAVTEARTACKEYNQARTNLENAQEVLNPTLQNVHQHQQAFFSAALRAKTTPPHLYEAMRGMQDVLKELSAILRKEEDHGWCLKPLLRNNFTCAVWLLREAADVYEDMPRPFLQGHLCDHVHNLSTAACDVVDAWPMLPTHLNERSQAGCCAC